MAGLLDIARKQATVEIGGVHVVVNGVSAKSIANLMGRFSGVAELLSAGGITAADIAKLGPEVAGAIIAAGTGNAGDAEAEAFAADLNLGIQLDLIGAIIDVSMPSGNSPLVRYLRDTLGGMAVARLPDQSPESPSIQHSTPAEEPSSQPSVAAKKRKSNGAVPGQTNLDVPSASASAASSAT